ncbi:MAG: ankyrin repeat domain-containing protein [Desulfarculus sp.]|nr:ankyrin repeat domain-containing protein [Desulfarculus sp.]
MQNIIANQALWTALWQKAPDGARQALMHGADPNGGDPASGLSPLMLAAGTGCLEIVDMLIAAGALVNALDDRAGASALHKACQGGHLAAARRLIQAGALINLQCTSTGHTPLFEAIWFKSVEVVRLVLQSGARADLALRTNYGFSLDDHINYALKVNQGQQARENLTRIQELIAARRQDDARAAQNPLLVAVRAGDLQGMRDALGKGAGLEARYPVVGEFDDGHTALLIASRNGQTEMVRGLVAAGADVNAVEPVFGAVPLHKATYNGHLEITRVLAAAPGVNLDYQGPSNGYSPLLDAIWHGFADCAQVLLDAGASTEVIGYDGKHALDLAREELGPSHPLTIRLASPPT